MDELLVLAKEAALLAGKQILTFYHHPVSAEIKQDGSPITLADKTAHQTISTLLASTDYPVVSEEGEDLYMGAEAYWLVDPLDGTKDFIAHNDEFTVNIALIQFQRPILGVVYAPALDLMYFGGVGLGAWVEQAGNLCSLESTQKSPALTIAVSRFHDHADVDVFAEQNHIDKRISVGSALKYGFLAEGKVDIFPRLVGSSEWDTAAGQAVLEAAGGSVLDWHSGQALRYGKPNRRNPRLLSFRTPYRLNDFCLKQYEYELL